MSRHVKSSLVALALTIALALVISSLSLGRAEGAGDDGFRLKVELVVGDAGERALQVTVDIDAIYHWNEEYPAKVEIAGELPDGLTMATRSLSAKDGGIKASPQRASAAFPFTMSGEARGEIAVKAKFSICNERVCLMKTANGKVALGG